MQADPAFAQAKIKAFEQDPKRSKFGPVLCKIIQEQCPDALTISFADNKLRSLEFFATLHERVPNLLNLSFQNNNLNSFKDLEGIKGHEFKQLNELVLVGNPLKEREVGKTGSDINYKSNIKRMFPSIKMLDMGPVLEEVCFPVDDKIKLPVEVLGGFMDAETTTSTAVSFLESYYNLFDNNRSQLLNYYADEAVFTLSINLIRPSNNSKQIQKPSRSLFDGWIQHDHNLDSLKNAGRMY